MDPGVALVYPVTARITPFLAKGTSPPGEGERVHEAWRKGALLQVILGSYPYVRDGDF